MKPKVSPSKCRPLRFHKQVPECPDRRMMMISLTCHTLASDIRTLRDTCTHERARTARSRRRQEQLEVQRLASQAMIDLRDQQIHKAALLALEAAIAKWFSTPRAGESTEPVLTETKQAAKADRLDHDDRKIIQCRFPALHAGAATSAAASNIRGCMSAPSLPRADNARLKKASTPPISLLNVHLHVLVANHAKQ